MKPIIGKKIYDYDLSIFLTKKTLYFGEKKKVLLLAALFTSDEANLFIDRLGNKVYSFYRNKLFGVGIVLAFFIFNGRAYVFA